jgi:hypothetical protein
LADTVPLVLSFVAPIASNVKSGYEAFIGVDPITGEPVEGLTRVIAFGGIFGGKIVVNVAEGLINLGGRVSAMFGCEIKNTMLRIHMYGFV